MAKFTNYMFVMLGFFVVFYLFGLNSGGFTGGLLTLLFNPENITRSSLNTLFGIFGGTLVLGVTALALRSYFSESLALIPFIPVLAGFLIDFISIYSTIKSVSLVLAMLVLAPMMVVYVLTVIEWWRGVST